MQKRAGDGIRTRDIKHGKLVLYQLSYSRSAPGSCVRPKTLFRDVERPQRKTSELPTGLADVRCWWRTNWMYLPHLRARRY